LHAIVARARESNRSAGEASRLLYEAQTTAKHLVARHPAADRIQ
jgi:hypothetical protein